MRTAFPAVVLALLLSGIAAAAPVYIVVGSDTTAYYQAYPTFASPDGNAARVMQASYREALRDSYGQTIKFTWWLNCGGMFQAACSSAGPLISLNEMMEYRLAEVQQWGDEMAFHYHTMGYFDADGDGVPTCQQSPDFTYNEQDFDFTVSRMILERNFFASSFRSGWNWMDNLYNNHLDQWFQYRLENEAGIPSHWYPYHPSPTNYRAYGSCRGYETRSKYIPSASQSLLNAAFAQAEAGTPQLMCLWSHLTEADYPEQAAALDARLHVAATTYPTVPFEYCTAVEAYRLWKGGDDVTPPQLTITSGDSDGVRTIEIASNEDIYQIEPWVAYEDLLHKTSRLPTTSLGDNHWQVSYPLDAVLSASVAVTDWWGNATVVPLPVPLRIADLAVSVTSTTATITWKTGRPANSVVDYGLSAGYGSTMTDPTLVTSHSITLIGLTPGTQYHFRASSTDMAGISAQSPDQTFITLIVDPLIVDDLDPGFAILSGTWSQGSHSPVYWGENYIYKGTASSETGAVSWTPVLPRAGCYQVYTWYSPGSNRSTAAPYRVVFEGGSEEVPVNQQTDGSDWRLIGSYPFARGTRGYLRLGNMAPTGYVVIADAARFAFDLYDQIIDNGDPGFSVTGAWDTTAPSGAFGPDSVQAAGAGGPTPTASAIWRPRLVEAGQYDVLVWFAGGADRSDQACFVVHGNTSEQMFHVKQSLGGFWYKLGTFYFVAGELGYCELRNSDSDPGTVVIADAVRFRRHSDTPPPALIISGVSASAGSTTATITWATDRAANSVVEYGITTDYGETAFDSAMVGQHTITLSGLALSTRYHFRVTSTDLDGVSAQSTDQTFTTVPADDLIVDNLDPGFTILSGSWSSGTSPVYWGTNYRFSTIASSETGATAWTATIPQAGFYEVYTWYTPGSNRSTDAHYRVTYDGGSVEVIVNQQVNGSQWRLLGTFPFAAGQQAQVRLSNQAATPSVVIADAARWHWARSTFQSPVLPAGWNLISLPADPEFADPAEVFAGLPLDGNLHRYDPIGGTYVAYYGFVPQDFGNCVAVDGYWLYLLEPTQIGYLGALPSVGRERPLPVAGWHMVGSHSDTTVRLADCQYGTWPQFPPAMPLMQAWAEARVGMPLFGYDPANLCYSTTGLDGPPLDNDDSLRPWQGYWFNAHSSGWLIAGG